MNFPRVFDLFELRGKSLSRRGFYKNTNCEEHNVFYFGPFDRDSTERIFRERGRPWSAMPTLPRIRLLHRLNIRSVHEKNDFTEVSKNSARYRSENNFVWTNRNNYVERSNFARMLKYFAACQKCLSVLHNYSNSSTKLFSELYLAKFLDTSAKPFFHVTISWQDSDTSHPNVVNHCFINWATCERRHTDRWHVLMNKYSYL